MSRNTKQYSSWNGKSVDGQINASNSFLTKEGPRNSTAELKYELGVDTIAADDLQAGMDYDIR